MQVALRRRLRLPLPLASRHCGGDRGYGCGAPSDPFGDHATACHRTGLLARRAKVVELAWLRVAREAVGAEGRVIAQPLLGGYEHTGRVLLRSTPIGHRHLWG